MADKLKSVLLGKLFHLGHNHRVFAGSPQPGQVGIINDANTCGVTPKT
jgi:hypothetical protein